MTEPYDHLLEAYARLVVRVGVNVQLGQRVVVRGMVEHADVARAVAAEAYRVGASHVTIDYVDQHLQRATVDMAPERRWARPSSTRSTRSTPGRPTTSPSSGSPATRTRR